MKRYNRITAVIAIVLGAYVAITAQGMSLIVNRAPGPGFLPFGLGLLLILIGVLMMTGTFSAKADDSPASFSKEELKNLASITGTSAAVLVLTPLLGIVIPLGLMTGAMALLLGERRKHILVLLTIATPVVMYLVFSVALNVRMPMGIFK